ncbi:MAG TPA: hypothetical protein VMS02_03445, partial [Solirubrobacteraceae bacterium]|nr:hypothetical protein [Solirubrobacteraceae bacterium]
MSAVTALAPDAAMALGIAATAMPFARTPEDEAERWLRVLRLHGQAGIVLQALGVSEGALPGSGGAAAGAGGPREADVASRTGGPREADVASRTGGPGSSPGGVSGTRG